MAFYCEKSIANATCGKCLVQTYGFTFVLSNCFPFHFHEILFKLVGKAKQIYVWPKLVDYIFTTSFGLWMSKEAHDVFALVINFLGFN